jgi:hypothetical protein
LSRRPQHRTCPPEPSSIKLIVPSPRVAIGGTASAARIAGCVPNVHFFWKSKALCHGRAASAGTAAGVARCIRARHFGRELGIALAAMTRPSSQDENAVRCQRNVALAAVYVS